MTSANTDAFSEVILDLSPHFNAKDGLFTQYLRIRPLEHNVKPCIRVSVYGVDPRAEARTVSALGEEWREGTLTCTIMCNYQYDLLFHTTVLSV